MPEPIHIDEQGNILIKINWRRMLKVVVTLVLVWVAYYLPIPGLTDASRICLMIFVGAAGLWVTEAIPSFATAIAFSTGTVETKEMAKAGTLVSLLGIVVLMVLALLMFDAEG